MQARVRPLPHTDLHMHTHRPEHLQKHMDIYKDYSIKK